MVLSRRTFGKKIISHVCSGALVAHSSQKAFAKNICEQDIKEDKAFVAFEKWNVNFWIDGAYESYKTRLCILLKLQQTKKKYLIKAVLASKSKVTLGVRYFRYEHKIANDYPPYLIFDNLSLVSYNEVYLYLLIKEGDHAKIYRHVFTEDDLKRSVVDSMPWPSVVKEDLLKLNDGFISNALYPPIVFLDEKVCLQDHKSDNSNSCYALHSIRANLLSLDSKTSKFNMQIFFDHEDLSNDHFMRYFIITDPVGKILGIKKRSFNDDDKKSLTISNVNDFERKNLWKFDLEDPSQIRDCPFVMIFVDDGFNGIFVSYLWLH